MQRRAFLRYCRNLARGLQFNWPDASLKKVGGVVLGLTWRLYAAVRSAGETEGAIEAPLMGL